MIPAPPKSKYEPGTAVRVIQTVRVGDLKWRTVVVGVVEGDGLRPVGGTEMGGKSLYVRQPTIRLRKEDGEITVVALDDDTTVEVLQRA